MSRYVPAGESRVWTTRQGTGTPMLLFNGGPGCDDYLEPVSRLIEDVCDVVRFEPRGCGRSSWDGRYDLRTLLDDADAVRRAYGIDRCILAGHSFGPDVALAYALTYPGHGLGILGIAGGKIVNDRSWSAAYHEARDTIGEDTGGVTFHADPLVNRVGNETWREFCRHPAFLRRVAELPIPCAYINAANDIRPTWPTRQLAALVPKGRYTEISGAAHHIWLTHADELADAMHESISWILAESGRG